MSRPRVLLVTPFPPFPPDNGGLLRIYSLAARLKERCEISLLTFVRRTGERRFQQNAAAIALGGLFKEVHAVEKESSGGEGAPADLPATAREWYSPKMAAKLSELSASGRFDLVHIEFLILASYVRSVRGIPAVLTEHDTSHLSFFRSYYREWTGFGRWARVGEWLRTRRYHAGACRAFDRIVTLTPEDRGRLAAIVPAEKLHLIPTCTDLDKFSYRPEGSEGRPTDLAFVGHYPHYPNEDAALWFCKEVLPRVRASRPGTTLSLIGSGPTPAVRALAGDGISVTGTVPDIRPHLDRAKVFVAPVRLGFGVKGKVLEAFGRGLPVVATTGVLQGIPQAERDKHMLVADDPAGFARETKRLLDNPDLRRRLAENANTLVRRFYDWESSCALLLALYKEFSSCRAVQSAVQIPKEADSAEISRREMSAESKTVVE